MTKSQIEQLKKWVSEYAEKFSEKGLEAEAMQYSALVSAIEFAETDKSMNMVAHLYKIRSQIQEHINLQNFDSHYKELNQKLLYQMNKMITKIMSFDFARSTSPNELMRMFIFKYDVEHYSNSINNFGAAS